MVRSSHYFIGIPLKKEIQDWLWEWQEALNPYVSYKIWPHPDDFHITLKFLGSATEDRIHSLQERLNNGPYPSSFSLKVGTLSFFGSSMQPRVMWAGVEKSPSLLELQQVVEEQCRVLGFPPENRPYRPHITLGKKWKSPDLSLSDQNFDTILPPPKKRIMEVDRFCLFRIHPSKKIKYEAVHTEYLREK